MRMRGAKVAPAPAAAPAASAKARQDAPIDPGASVARPRRQVSFNATAALIRYKGQGVLAHRVRTQPPAVGRDCTPRSPAAAERQRAFAIRMTRVDVVTARQRKDARRAEARADARKVEVILAKERPLWQKVLRVPLRMILLGRNFAPDGTGGYLFF